MFRLLLIVAVVIVGGFLVMRSQNLLTGKPLQGMVQVPESRVAVLASCARPAMYFVPAADMTGREAGWRTVRPKSRSTDQGSARLSLALYDNGTGMLVTALAEAEDKWKWEAPHHTPFPAIYTHIEPFPYETGGDNLPEQLHESVYVLDSPHNPFAAIAVNKDTAHLVYRAKSVLFFGQMQVLFEYHEPLDAESVRHLRADSPIFEPFLLRARQACSMRFPNREQAATLKDGIERLEPAAEVLSRTALSRWLGELQHLNQH